MPCKHQERPVDVAQNKLKRVRKTGLTSASTGYMAPNATHSWDGSAVVELGHSGGNVLSDLDASARGGVLSGLLDLVSGDYRVEKKAEFHVSTLYSGAAHSFNICETHSCQQRCSRRGLRSREPLMRRKDDMWSREGQRECLEHDICYE